MCNTVVSQDLTATVKSTQKLTARNTISERSCRCEGAAVPKINVRTKSSTKLCLAEMIKISLQLHALMFAVLLIPHVLGERPGHVLFRNKSLTACLGPAADT